MSLRDRTFSAVRWTTVAAVARVLLQTAQVAVLARLLSPSDYGLMAMVGVVLSFAGLFADLGVNSAFVQRQDVTEKQRSSLFWLNVCVSTALSAVVVAISPLAARFFQDPRLTPLIMLSSVTFVVSALGQQVVMSAEKTLNFRPVVLVQTAAALLGFGAALIAALAGLGVYSLVLSGIISSLTGTVLAWWFIAGGWRPLLRLRADDVWPFLGFGTATVANNIVNQINMTVDLFLGSRLLSAAQLGLYSVPRNLTLQIQFVVNPVVTRVGFPLIAEVQDDIARVRSIYLKTLNMTASTTAPLYVGIAAFAPEVVTILLGPKWTASAALLRVLALWGFLRSTGNPVGSLLLGMGRADLSLKWNLGMLCVIPPALWIGSQYGPAGLAWTLLTIAVALYVPGWLILVRPLCRAGLVEYSVAALRPLLMAAASVAPAYLVAWHLDSPLLSLGVGVLVAGPLYLAISLLGNSQLLAAMLELLAGRRPHLFSRRRPPVRD